ncbi:hypothetical protein AVEN_200043-1, partial [Araneus ventricosus]
MSQPFYFPRPEMCRTLATLLVYGSYMYNVQLIQSLHFQLLIDFSCIFLLMIVRHKLDVLSGSIEVVIFCAALAAAHASLAGPLGLGAPVL